MSGATIFSCVRAQAYNEEWGPVEFDRRAPLFILTRKIRVFVKRGKWV